MYIKEVVLTDANLKQLADGLVILLAQTNTGWELTRMERTKDLLRAMGNTHIREWVLIPIDDLEELKRKAYDESNY